MRFKKFNRRRLDTGTTETLGFESQHFHEAGVPYAPMAGMPVLEAYQLTNQWNQAQVNPRFIYWLEA